MVTRNRLREVRDYLKKIDGEISITELVKRLEKDGIMSHATAWKVIPMAVESGMIMKRNKEKGKINMVYRTAHPKYEEFEQTSFEKMKKLLELFDENFHLLRKKYSQFTI